MIDGQGKSCGKNEEVEMRFENPEGERERERERERGRERVREGGRR